MWHRDAGAANAGAAHGKREHLVSGAGDPHAAV